MDLATRAANGKVRFTITRAAATSNDLSAMSEVDLQNLTKLPNEIQSGTITNRDENIPNSKAVVGTEILFTNEEIKNSYSINAVGLYAQEEGKSEEILYALNIAVEPEFMPDFADKVLLQFKITMYIIVGRTENVTVIIDPTGLATKEYVKDRIAEIDINDKIQDSNIDNQLQKQLAYSEYKSKDLNKVTQIAEAVGHMTRGFKIIDNDGNIDAHLPDPSDGLIDISDLSLNGSGGSDKDHPAAGIDYYAGSMENGEITDRHIAYSSSTNPINKTNIKFELDVGNKLNMIGTGLQYIVNLQKTAITKGVMGKVSKIPFNYDPKNAFKAGYYTTTAPVPMYTKSESFEVDEPNTITLEGIGENLGMKNHKAPGFTLTFKSDKTMDIEPIQGYDNDGDSGGVNGFIYDPVIEFISTYNVQPAVVQFPTGTLLFSGNTSAEVALTAVNDFMTNVSGLKIELNNAMRIVSPHNSIFGISRTELGLPNTIYIPRSALIFGFDYLSTESSYLSHVTIKPVHYFYGTGGNESIDADVKGFSNSIKIGNSSIKVTSNTWLDNKTKDTLEGKCTLVVSVKTVSAWKVEE
ncbi:hypothetical protein IV57_GL000204 [Companilactobacillus kimchiensis]|uniref:Uncharacterized protein n=1 Tax=Companilactobacillus kimchiensis TaxID=993692 RepID=A0A0R2LN52_9LACO|nr:hypothetical protein IV57_GL000204 [Companilactobacillus kimchiensis]